MQTAAEGGKGDDFALELARMKLRAKVEQIKNLPTLPQVVSHLLSMMVEDTCSASQLSQEISKDQSLTAKILKVVNSAYYGFHRQISALADAVVILGLEEIQRLTATIAVFGMVHIKPIGDFSPRALWEHSVATAAGAEMISNLTPHPSKGAFVCGLLHDIGKVVFDQFFNPQWQAVVLKAQEKSLWIGIPEQKEFGTHHGEIGAWLTERWSLPPWIVEGIRFHHETVEPHLISSASNLWLVVQLADRIAREENYGSGGDKQMPPAFPGIEEYLSIQPEQIEDIRNRLKDQMERLRTQWNFLGA
ncbi:MAG TPA: HDOD domain-containing protein [bacterium]|nr:HDOD domain-containing protein [bacterium]